MKLGSDAIFFILFPLVFSQSVYSLQRSTMFTVWCSVWSLKALTGFVLSTHGLCNELWNIDRCLEYHIHRPKSGLIVVTFPQVCCSWNRESWFMLLLMDVVKVILYWGLQKIDRNQHWTVDSSSTSSRCYLGRRKRNGALPNADS